MERWQRRSNQSFCSVALFSFFHLSDLEHWLNSYVHDRSSDTPTKECSRCVASVALRELMGQNQSIIRNYSENSKIGMIIREWAVWCWVESMFATNPLSIWFISFSSSPIWTEFHDIRGFLSRNIVEGEGTLRMRGKGTSPRGIRSEHQRALEKTTVSCTPFTSIPQINTI